MASRITNADSRQPKQVSLHYTKNYNTHFSKIKNILPGYLRQEMHISLDSQKWIFLFAPQVYEQTVNSEYPRRDLGSKS